MSKTTKRDATAADPTPAPKRGVRKGSKRTQARTARHILPAEMATEMLLSKHRKERKKVAREHLLAWTARVLVDATAPLTAKELTEKAFDSETDEANTRYHIRELKKELKAAFPGFEEELLEGGADGYRLKLRK